MRSTASSIQRRCHSSFYSLPRRTDTVPSGRRHGPACRVAAWRGRVGHSGGERCPRRAPGQLPQPAPCVGPLETRSLAVADWVHGFAERTERGGLNRRVLVIAPARWPLATLVASRVGDGSTGTSQVTGASWTQSALDRNCHRNRLARECGCYPPALWCNSREHSLTWTRRAWVLFHAPTPAKQRPCGTQRS